MGFLAYKLNAGVLILLELIEIILTEQLCMHCPISVYKGQGVILEQEMCLTTPS